MVRSAFLEGGNAGFDVRGELLCSLEGVEKPFFEIADRTDGWVRALLSFRSREFVQFADGGGDVRAKVVGKLARSVLRVIENFAQRYAPQA